MTTMTRRTAFQGLAATALQAAPEQPGKRRNVVMMIIDGQRAEMMGCAGNRILKTPNIDALAARGVRFENSFCVHGVCMPTRASIFTGRYPSAHRAWANGVPLSRNEVTLAQVVSDNGYQTGASGKLHFEPQLGSEYPPALDRGAGYYGFREVHLSENIPGVEYLAFLRKNYPTLVEQVRKRQPLPEEAHSIHWIVDQTLDFIGRASRKEAPFFAYCSFGDLIPNSPRTAGFKDMYAPADMPMPKRRPGELDKKPPHYKQAYEHMLARNRYPDEAAYRLMMAEYYYGQMSFLDKQVGRLVSTLESLGQLDDTTIILTADHGLCLADHWMHLHGPWPYDQVMKVPLVLAGPGIPRGRVIAELVEDVDIMPTTLDYLGLPLPAGVQGTSLRPLIEGRAGAHGKQTVWMDDREAPDLESNFGVRAAGFHVRVIRSKTWKYVHYQGQPLGELYDLRNDPDEFDNLWSDPGYRKLRNECHDQFLERLISVQDPLPVRHYVW